jgi:aspartate/methionine/tyrosine aminotransferase
MSGVEIQARAGVQALRSQQIREVAGVAAGRPDVLPFWFGESNLTTPQAIRTAATAALQKGQTLYAPTLGVHELRESLSQYLTQLHQPVPTDRIAITNSGVTALMLALQALISPGDRVVAVTPVWPNLCEIPRILGARVECVPLRFGDQGWSLDLQRLLAAVTADTTALVINSPNNPTGWTLSRAEQEAILRHCRTTGTWLVADDVYERIYFQGSCAPSFLDLVAPADRFIGCNSFSKAWRMTGWRIGWLVIPRELLWDLSKLIEYNSSCAPPFVQLAACVALTACEADVADQVSQIRMNQSSLYELLRPLDTVELGAPAAGAMYAFFRVKGLQDSLALCKRLVLEAGVGLAPGAAFGAEAPEFLRWCLAVDPGQLAEGARRFVRFMESASG